MSPNKPAPGKKPPTSADVAAQGGHGAQGNAARRAKQIGDIAKGSAGGKNASGAGQNKKGKGGGGKAAQPQKPQKNGKGDQQGQEDWAQNPRQKRLDRALAAAADNRNPTKQIADGEGLKGKAANAATEGIAQAIKYTVGGGSEASAKAVRAAGAFIGPTGVLAIVFVNFLPLIMLGFVVFMMISVFIGGVAAVITGTESGETTAGGTHPQAQQSPNGLAMDEIKKAAAQHNVPWTVIAAIGEGATELGKFSPYDNIDRDPGREGRRRAGAGGTVDGTIGADGTPSLLGPTTLTAAQIKEYWQGTGRGQPQRLGAPIEEIIELYLQEADAEGLRGDFVFAQAIAETGHFSNPDTSLNNFAGIAHYDNAPRGQEFPDPRTGVRAHVQLLKKYAGGNDVQLANPDVAPRAGASSATWGGLAGTWASDRGYWTLLRGVYTSMGGNLDGINNTATGGGQAGSGSAGGNQSGGAGGGAQTGTATKVVVVGDGLCVGIGGSELQQQLENRGYSATLNCEAGRTMETGAAVLADVLTSDTGVVVVALGTANAGAEPGAYNAETFNQALDDIIARVNKTPVVFVEPFTTQPQGDVINQALRGKRQAAARVYVNGVEASLSPLNRTESGLTEPGQQQWARAVSQAADIAGKDTGAGSFPQNPDGVEIQDFPEALPAIGGGDGEGVGPYLIEKQAAEQAGINPQALTFSGVEIKTATDYIASELSAIRYRMIGEGWSPDKGQDAFWEEAVRRLPVVDPRGASCKTGDVTVAGSDEEKRAIVNAEIRYMWKCELTGELYTLTGIDKTEDEYTNKLSGATQTDTIVGEAVLVAQAFSQSGTAACDEAAELAGVFPLTQAVFDEYADGGAKQRGRCDPAANIQAAARAFAEGERVVPGTKGQPGGNVRVSAEGKTFPVNGPNTFSNDYGAPRPAGTSPCDCHQGVDIFAERGVPIVAIESGLIVQAERVRDGGLVIGLQGDSGMYYYMDHLDSIRENITKGVRVKVGDELGGNGNTGDAAGTPPHLHIQGHPAGVQSEPVNIYNLLVELSELQAAPGVATPEPGLALEPAVPETNGIAAGELGDRSEELGVYAPMIGGWWAMPWVLGDQQARDTFMRTGPVSTWEPSEECKREIDNWLRGDREALPDEATCGGRPAQIATLAANRIRVALMQLDGEPSPLGSTTTVVDAGNDDEARQRLTSKLAELGTNAVTGGVDNIIPRFNEQAENAAGVGGGLGASRATGSDYPALVVQLAVGLGGLYPGDTRFEENSDPYSVLTAFNAPRPGGEGLGGNGLVGGSIPFSEQFNAAGAEYGIDPRMLAAVAWTESGFREDIISCANPSSAGALGIMQFLPSTAAGMGVDPCRPESAIPGAARLLKGHHERFGTWELAWAAYNAGGGAVERYGGVPPFTETQNYVVKVAERWEQYKQEFPGGTVIGGGPISAQGFIWPTQGAVTSPYGPRWGTFHYGLDVGAPSGTPIFTVADGTVTFSGVQGGYGNFVIVDHGNGVVTRYGHQSQLASQVGQRVQQGEIIGYVGSTGDSTGPHLHFEIQLNGQFIDPRPYLP